MNRVINDIIIVGAAGATSVVDALGRRWSIMHAGDDQVTGTAPAVPATAPPVAAGPLFPQDEERIRLAQLKRLRRAQRQAKGMQHG